MSDYDPRIVELYDQDNPDGQDHDFYRSLASELGARSILDLGCGTGLLTVTLSGVDRTVMGIDPSETMLDYARKRPFAERVAWVIGTSAQAPADQFDLAIMSGNVAQHISDADWRATLHDVRYSLRPGGSLSFESRNPAARAWERWDSGERISRDTRHGPLVEWMHVGTDDDRTVSIEAHNLFSRTGDEIIDTQTLVFRSRDEIAHDLDDAGFDVSEVYGGWDRASFDEHAPIMVFVAHAR